MVFNKPVPYDTGIRIQQRLYEARLAGAIPDTVLFLEHEPVVTMGRRGRRNHLVVSEEELRARGIQLALASRGGDVTYHGPGQLVMYPILRLGAREADSHGYLGNLEEIAIRTAAAFGVEAFRREGMSGAWTGAGKLAAIGFQIKRWITLHGMSFNVAQDPGGFRLIVGCGLVGERVVSLRELLGERCPELGEVRAAMIAAFEAVCARPLRVFAADQSLPDNLAALIR